MSPNAKHTGTPRQWLHIAEADLALASVPLPPRGLYEQLCFHAQQAVEKSLKAILVGRSIDFPQTHSIQRLIDLLPSDIARPSNLFLSARLTEYAVTARYPGDDEPVDEEEYREALRIATAILAWAKRFLG